MKFIKRFLLFINLVFLKGGEDNMVELYAILIIKEKRTIDNVPPRLRDEVIAVLAAAGLDESGKPIQ